MQRPPARRTGAEERKPRRPGPPQPTKKNTGLVIGIAAGAVVVVCVLAAFAMSGGKPKDELPVAPPAPVVKAVPPPAAPPPAPPPPPPPAPVSHPPPTPIPDANDKYEKQAEDRHKLLERQVTASDWDNAEQTHKSLVTVYKETKYVVANRAAIDKLGQLVRAKPLPGYDAYVKRVEKRVQDGNANVARAKEAIERDRKLEADAAAAVAKRLAGRTFSIKQRGGPALAGATILAAGRDVLRVRVTGVERELAWRVIDDKSLLELGKAIHADQGAPGLYELGRLCFDAKLWKEAKDAWQKCVKADATQEKRIPFAQLEKLIRGEGLFRGSYKVTGGDTLSVTYDFADRNQATDFEARGESGLSRVDGDGLILEAQEAIWTFKELDFVGDVSFEAQVDVEKDAWAVFSLMGTWDGNRYEVVVGHSARIDRIDERERTILAEGTDKFTGKADVKVTYQKGTIKAFVNGREVMNAKDDKYQQGYCGIGAFRARRVAFRKLTIAGRVVGDQLDKQGSDVEVDARRLLEGLADRPLGAAVIGSLTADDDYLLGMLDKAQREAYERARRVAQDASAGRDVPDGEFGRARAALRNLIRDKPDFIAARYWRFRMLQRDAGAGRREAEEMQEDLAAFAARADFPEGQALIAERRSDFAEARRFLDAALKGLPDHASSISLRGILRHLQRDAQGGFEDLGVAAMLGSADQEVRMQYQAALWAKRGAEAFGARHRVETKHYIVVTDTSPEKAKLYAERLEAAYKHYAGVFKSHFREDAARPKSHVAVFNSKESYRSFSQLTSLDRHESWAGHYSLLFKHLVLYEDREEEETLNTLYHEGCHQFVNQIVDRAPIWWNEGIAEYLSGIKIEKGVVVKTGLLQEKRLKLLKRYLDYTAPFAQIMNESTGEFRAFEGLRYPQAWSMLHFFYEYSGGKYRPLIEKYWDCIASNKDQATAFREAFGGVRLEPMEAEWRKYVQDLK